LRRAVVPSWLALIRPIAALFFALALLSSETSPPAGAQSTNALRVISREGTRQLAIIAVGNQDYVALDEVAAMFGLTLREDRLAGGITVTAGSRSIIITPDQPVVSVAGSLVPLSSAPVRQGNRWLVPLDFLQRAVGPALQTRLELRRASRLLIAGDVRVPRVSVRVEPSPSSATVIADITPSTPQRVSMEGGRLNISFDADALDLILPGVAPQDFVQSIQPGDTPTSIRIVPGPKFGMHRTTTSQPDATSSRLMLELLPAGAEPPAPPPPPAPPAADPLPMPLPSTGVRTIVIDPGHGGEETGARGAAGVLEKEVTLGIARRLRTMIETRLGLRVFLTRDDDRPMTLDDRAAYANSQRADVFISIHANAGLRPTLKGAEVYYLTTEGGGTESDQQPGNSTSIVLPLIGGGNRNVDLVRWEAVQVRHLAQSASLAGIVEQTLRARVEMSARPVQQAPFRVLVGAAMPAVLVEVGYLSNTEQEQLLASGSYQDQVALALFDAVVQFRQQVERTAR
jgi:N-acetylmuramoyl-L-alanine amidase